MHPMLSTALVGVGFAFIAWLLWFVVRKWDRANAVIASAAPLPIKLVNVWDSVWIRGDMNCPEPLSIPWFGYFSVHFTYRLEEEVVRTTTDKDGKTETTRSWVTRDTRERATPFHVCQESDSLWVDAARAQWHYEKAETQQVGIWRHSCSYIPYPGQVSVVGVVGEKKETLEPLRHVPLMVTPRGRADYIMAAESAERWAARFGLVFLFVGCIVSAFGLVRYAQAPSGVAEGQWWNPVAGALAVLIGMFATALLWGLRVYNTMVIFRTRSQQCWSQIDVQLKQRYDLIPSLVEVVKGYLAHEKGLLEGLTAIRGKALAGGMTARVGAESAAVAGLMQIMARAEAYPDLKANLQFQKLSDQLTALEDKIAHARAFFNDSVAEYNTTTQVFPAALVARLCKFEEYPLFAAELSEKAPPRIQAG